VVPPEQEWQSAVCYWNYLSTSTVGMTLLAFQAIAGFCIGYGNETLFSVGELASQTLNDLA
jgi:hypothetical protein